MTVYGYARVSTADQDLGPQLAALRGAGVEDGHVFTDHVSGARAQRPGLDAVMANLVRGDVLVVWKLDRMGRSLSHLVHTVEELGERGVGFRSLTEALDTSSASGRLLLHIVGAMAEFERELVHERTMAGLALAKANGKQLGRRSTIPAVRAQEVLDLHRAGKSQAEISERLAMKRSTVGRIVRGEILSLLPKLDQLREQD